jgi:hypothetical protein
VGEGMLKAVTEERMLGKMGRGRRRVRSRDGIKRGIWLDGERNRVGRSRPESMKSGKIFSLFHTNVPASVEYLMVQLVNRVVKCDSIILKNWLRLVKHCFRQMADF